MKDNKIDYLKCLLTSPTRDEIIYTEVEIPDCSYEMTMSFIMLCNSLSSFTISQQF